MVIAVEALLGAGEEPAGRPSVSQVGMQVEAVKGASGAGAVATRGAGEMGLVAEEEVARAVARAGMKAAAWVEGPETAAAEGRWAKVVSVAEPRERRVAASQGCHEGARG